MFELNSRLVEDSFEFTEWPVCNIRVMNNAFFPWLILIPRIEGVKELIDLQPVDASMLWDEMLRAQTVLQEIFQPDKLNVAALGNQVSQLHVHVIARWQGDKSWPNPVWGGASVPYTEELWQEMKERLSPLVDAF